MAEVTTQSLQEGINKLLKDIQTTGIGKPGDVNYLAPQSLTTQAGKIQPTIAPTITPTIAPIVADTLGQIGKPIQIPAPTPKPDIAGSMIAGVEAGQKSIEDYVKLFTPTAESAESKKIKELTTQVESLIPEMKGRGAAQLEAEEKLEIPGQTQALKAVQDQITIRLAEFKKVEADYLKAVQATEQVPGTTTGIVAGQQREIQKALNVERVAQAAEIGILQSQASALSGNLSLAQSQANRAVDLKYSDIQDELNIRLQQLKLIEPELTKQEKIRADAITQFLNDQKTQISTAQANEKQLISFNLDAMKNYPSAQIGINNSYQTTQNKILGSREYQLATAPTPTTNIPTPGQPTPGQPIISLTGKPLTDTQSTALGYAQRMNDANKIITDLGSKFTGVLNYISGLTFFPNILKSEDRQNYEQAQRNFINSVLRKESGAAISPSEFDSAAKQYFPQPGDSQAVIDQKTANRTRSINNLLQSANVSSSVLNPKESIDNSYEAYLKAVGQ